MKLRTPFTIAELTIALRLSTLFGGDWEIDDERISPIPLNNHDDRPSLWFRSNGEWNGSDEDRFVRMIKIPHCSHNENCWMECGRYKVDSAYIGPIPADPE